MTSSLVGRIVGLAFLSGARPFLTMAMAQAGVLFGVYAGWVEIHPDYAVLMTWPVIVAVCGLAVVEVILAHDEDADEIKRLAQLDKVGGVAATAYGTLLMFAIGEPVPEAVSGFSGVTAAASASPDVHLGSLVESATASQHPLWVQGATVLGAASLNVLLTWLRSNILDWLTDIGLDGLWNVLETGGVPLALVLVLFAPVAMLVLVVVATVLMGVLAVASRAWQKHADDMARVPCPHCSKRVRVEASLCPHCRCRITPQKWLGQEASTPPRPVLAT